MSPLVFKLIVGFFTVSSISGAGVGIWKAIEYSKIQDDNNPPKGGTVDGEMTDSMPVAESEKPEVSIPEEKNIPAIKAEETILKPLQQYVITSLNGVTKVHSNVGNYCIIVDKSNTQHKFNCKTYTLSDSLKTDYDALYSAKAKEDLWQKIDGSNDELGEDDASVWINTNKLYKFVLERSDESSNKTINDVKGFLFKLVNSNTTTLDIETIEENHKFCFRNEDSSNLQQSFCWSNSAD